MVNLTSIADIEVYLRPFSERVKTTQFTLDLTRQLTSAVGNPERRLRVVHIAGTSGKTTTSYYIAGLLHRAQQKVGLTVSPHIASITERVQIDGAPLSEQLFIRYFNEFIALVDASHLEPSYFELMMVFALWVFDKKGVDYAVVETGVGGLHDTSNICRLEDKVCVITDIGYDHTHMLGNTLAEITAQKAGIVAEHNLVCMYEQSEQVMNVVRRAADRYSATVFLAPAGDTRTYFERNFALAQFTYVTVAERDKLMTLQQADYDAVFTTIHVPGRLEKIQVNGTLFVLDGAHNEQKMSALLSTLDILYAGEQWPTLLALKQDKDKSSIIAMLSAYASEVVLSEFQTTQDMPAHASPASELANLFAESKLPTRVVPLIADGLQYFIDQHARHVLVTGSFFAVAEARAWLLNEKHGTIQS